MLGKHIGKEELRDFLASAKEELADNLDSQDRPVIEEQIKNIEDVLDFCDWNEDPEFIRHDWFWGGYAEILAQQLGPVEGWPYDCLDWHKAAEALSYDYKQVRILEDIYYVKA